MASINVQLDISDAPLHAAAREAWSRLPVAVKDRIARDGRLTRITDAAHPETTGSGAKAYGLCQPMRDGSRVIYLAPSGNRKFEDLVVTVVHELLHAAQPGDFHGPDFSLDEAVVESQLKAYGFTHDLLKIDWRSK